MRSSAHARCRAAAAASGIASATSPPDLRGPALDRHFSREGFAALQAELRTGGQFSLTLAADGREAGSAVQTKLSVQRVLVLAPRTIHESFPTTKVTRLACTTCGIARTERAKSAAVHPERRTPPRLPLGNAGSLAHQESAMKRTLAEGRPRQRRCDGPGRIPSGLYLARLQPNIVDSIGHLALGERVSFRVDDLSTPISASQGSRSELGWR
jgi:hypothetical protein